MSQYRRKIGGRYGMHSGSAKFRNLEVEGSFFLGGNSISLASRNLWFVNNSNSTSGDGLTWDSAFITLAEAVTAAGDFDTILIAPNTIETIGAAGIEINNEGLRIFGALSTEAHQVSALKITAGTASMFRIVVNRVEIGNLYMSQRTAYTCIEIGSASVGAVYETHIHDCNFDGYGTATYGVSGYGQTVDTVSLVVEDCYFMSFATAALHSNGTRDTYRRNTIIVPTSTTGIYVVENAGDRAYTCIVDNYLSGITDAVGIEFAGTPTAGTLFLARNYLSGTWGTSITDVNGGCMNYVTDASGGALINC